MTLIELKYIVAVAKMKHFGKAASICGVSQPTLSVAIKKLETELGLHIFERKNTEIVTTPTGIHIIRQAQAILEEVNKLKEIADYEKDPLDGPLNVGIIFTISPFLLPELVKKSLARTPQMPLVITEGYTAGLIQKLKAGEIDALICALPVYDPAGLMGCDLYDEDFVVVTSGNHPFAKKEVVKMEDLKQEEMLLLAPGNCLRDQVLEACPDRDAVDVGMSMNLRFTEGSSLQTLRHMVAGGLGISVFPASAVNYDLDDSLVRYLKIEPPVPFRRVSIIWRRTFKRDKAIMRLVETCASINLEGIRHLPSDPQPLLKAEI